MKPINDHSRAQELFSAFIDHQTTDDEKKFVERHLVTCDQDCRAVLAVNRSMIQATKTLPLVKAPRSFVLPKSMARQPARSIFTWYPALRLATSIAVIAFVLVFAGDLFSQRSVTLSANVPSAANALQVSGAAQPTAVALYSMPPESATRDQAPAPQSSAGILPTPTTTAPLAGNAASPARSTMTLTDETITATLMTTTEVALAPTPIAQPTAEAAPKVVTAAAPAANQVGAIEQTAAPSIDPLRVIEIVLAVLVVLLGTATLIARRRAHTN